MPEMERYQDHPDPDRDRDAAGEVEREESMIHVSERHVRRVRRVWGGFLDFALQGNIMEIALGLILAAAFTTIVNSFVSDILLPPLSVILPLNKNLEEKFAVLKPGPNFDPSKGYSTVKMAMEDSAVVMAYGTFINKCLNFLGVGLSLYALAGAYQYLSKDPILKHYRKCPFCRKNINEKAKRCVNCTSWVDGTEDSHH